MLIISLLGLAFAAMFTVLALGLVILTLILLVGVTLLLVGPLLLIPARVAVLAFNRRDFICIVLARAMAHSFRLILSKDSNVDVGKIKVLEFSIFCDNQDKHLPFLRESGEGNHHLKLLRDGDFSRAHAPKGGKEPVKVLSGVVVDAYACTKAVLKVFEDCRCHHFAICIVETVPHCKGCGAPFCQGTQPYKHGLGGKPREPWTSGRLLLQQPTAHSWFH